MTESYVKSDIFSFERVIPYAQKCEYMKELLVIVLSTTVVLRSIHCNIMVYHISYMIFF